MSKYVCNHAEFKTIENGSNKGKEYVVATFVPSGSNPRSARMAYTLNFFEPLVDAESWREAWDATVADPKSEMGQYIIDAKVIRVKDLEPHAKKYSRDITMKDKAGKEYNFAKGKARRIPGDPLHVQKFDYVDVFTEVDEDDKPYDDVQAIAERIIKNNCIPWAQIPDANKLQKEPEVPVVEADGGPI